MTSKGDAYLSALDPEDATVLRDALLTWRAEGVPNPFIPIGEDVTDDGIADSWGLDPLGRLIVVPGVPLADTVFHSDGTGFEGGES